MLIILDNTDGIYLPLGRREIMSVTAGKRKIRSGMPASYVVLGITFLVFGSLVCLVTALRYAAALDLFVHAKDQQTSYFDVINKSPR